jgi:hypothetical protein
LLASTRRGCHHGDVTATVTATVETAPRRAWWLVPEVAAVAVLLVAVVLRPGGIAGGSDLRAQLIERVVAALERASPTEHHDHGHQVTAADRVACVAELHGTDPVAARGLAEVREVYAQYMCAAGAPGTAYDDSSRSSGPVAVRLSDPPVVRVPPSGLGYPDRVRALLPDEYEEQALKGFRDPSVPAALRARYDAMVGNG